MGIIYFGSSQTPMRKCVMGIDTGTTATIWTPATGNRVAITDLAITQAATGTVRILAFSGADKTYPSTVMFEHIVVGSATVSHRFETPLINETPNGIVGVATGANGSWNYLNLGGFEF